MGWCSISRRHLEWRCRCREMGGSHCCRGYCTWRNKSSSALHAFDASRRLENLLWESIDVWSTQVLAPFCSRNASAVHGFYCLRLLLLFCTRVIWNEGETSINLNDLMWWKDMALGASLRCRQKNAVSATLCVETQSEKWHKGQPRWRHHFHENLLLNSSLGRRHSLLVNPANALAMPHAFSSSRLPRQFRAMLAAYSQSTGAHW